MDRFVKLPKLNAFIIQLLKEKNKPLTLGEMLKERLKQYNIIPRNSTDIKFSIKQALYQLERKKLISKTWKIDRGENLFFLYIKEYDPTEIVDSTDTIVNFEQFIIDTLQKHKRIFSLEDFVKYALVHYQISSSEKKFLAKEIYSIILQMIKDKNNLRRVINCGSRESYYGLKEWFNSKGELMTLYK